MLNLHPGFLFAIRDLDFRLGLNPVALEANRVAGDQGQAWFGERVPRTCGMRMTVPTLQSVTSRERGRVQCHWALARPLDAR